MPLRKIPADPLAVPHEEGNAESASCSSVDGAIGRHCPIVGIVDADPSIASLKSRPRLARFKYLFEGVLHSMQGPLPLRWEEAALHSPQGPQSARGFGQRPENRSNCVLQDGRERSVQLSVCARERSDGCRSASENASTLPTPSMCLLRLSTATDENSPTRWPPKWESSA